MDNQENLKNYTYYFEEHSLDQVNESLVGRKGFSLFQMHHADIPIPDFFVISPIVFSEFLIQALEHKSIIEKGKQLEKRDLREIFLRTKFSTEVEELIKRDYAKLSGFIDTWVSVRSSVVFPDKQEVSFSGIFNTKLNVRGSENLFKAIREIYLDFFSESVLQYCINEEVEMSDVKLAIVIQKMVQSEVSGVCYTVDPITQDNMRMSIEAVYGLGDVIANGEITPDTYVLNKKDLSVFEKHIAPQEWMKIRSLNSNSTETSEKIQISSAWSHKQKLDDNRIVDVAKVSLILEEKLGKAQDVEWVYAGGKIWALQAKNSFIEYNLNQSMSYGYGNFVSDSMHKVVSEILSRSSSSRDLVNKKTQIAAKSVLNTLQDKVAQVVEKQQERDTKVEEIVKKVEQSYQNDDKYILSGIGASYGTVTGEVIVVSNGKEIVSKGQIVVLAKYTKELYPTLLNAAGVVTEIGGLTSDISITCRELNIPAVVGVLNATKILKTGHIVKLDGSSGNIYEISSVNKEEVKVVEDIVTKLNENENVQIKEDAKEIKVVANDDVVKVSKDVDLPNTATKIFTSSYTNLSEYINSDGIMSISLDQLMIEDGRHPLAYVEEGKYKEYADRISTMIDKIAESISPNEVVISIGDRLVSQFNSLVKARDFEELKDSGNVYGAYRYLNSPKLLDLALKIVKRIRNVYKSRNVSLAINTPMNGHTIRELKKNISSLGLRRTNSFNVYIVIENTSELLLLEELISADVDGIVINSKNIAKSILGINRDDNETIFDINSPSVVRVVTDAVKSIKSKGVKVVIDTNDNQEMITTAIKLGAYGIIASQEKIREFKKLISSEEIKMILG